MARFSLHLIVPSLVLFFFFFFIDTATTEIYTLSLHDALPICLSQCFDAICRRFPLWSRRRDHSGKDRKSTRLNSSHITISYAVFCLKKKKMTDVTVDAAPIQFHETRSAAAISYTHWLVRPTLG